MKKLAVILALLTGLILFAASASAAPATSGTCGEGLVWQFSENGVLTVSGEGSMKNYRAGKTPWRAHTEAIKSVVIEEGVTHLGANAFNGCTALTRVSGMAGLKTVGTKAFNGCTALKTADVADLDAWCGVSFADRTASPMYYASSLYSGGMPVTVFTPGETVKKISAYTFYGCRSLASVTLPETVTVIGLSAFENCAALKTLNISGAPAIANNAFAGCKALVSGTLGKSLFWQFTSGTLTVTGYADMRDFNGKNMPWLALAAKTRTLDLRLLPYIGENAFKGFAAKTVCMPASLVCVGANAFAGCDNVTAVKITDLDSWCAVKFANAAANPLHAGAAMYLNGKKLTAPQFSKTLTKISAYVFTGCTSITKVSLPASVKEIGAYAFNNCTSLTSFAYKNKALKIGSRALAGCAALRAGAAGDIAWSFNAETGTLTVSGKGNIPDFGRTGYVPWQSVKTAVRRVEVAQGVTGVGNSAFAGCTRLTSFALAESVSRLDDNAFANCRALKKAVIPATVKRLGAGVFAGCNRLVYITLPFIGASAAPAAGESIRPFGYIFGRKAASDGKNEAKQNVYAGETGKPSETAWFAVPESLKKVTLTGGAVSRGAFENCKFIQTVVLKAGVEGIGEAAFKNCGGLQSVNFPRSVLEIGASAFENCAQLSSPVFGKNLRFISARAFRGCKKITEVTLPNWVSEIGDQAFYGCAALRTVSLNCSLQMVGDYAFAGCKNLKKATYGGSTLGWNKLYCGRGNAYLQAVLAYTDTGHSYTEKFKEVTPATCTKNGKIETGVRCVYCGDLLESEIKTLPKLGHAMTETDHLPSKEAGVKYILRTSCARCDYHVDKKIYK